MADQYTPPPLERSDVLELDDPAFAADRVAIVTGAASGIGRATAIALAANGLTVVGADVNVDGLHGTEDRATDMGLEGTVVPVRTDLTDDEAIERLVEVASDRGQVQYLANIAGLQHIDPLPDVPMERYDELLDVMLRAPFYLSKLTMAAMADRDGPAVIGNMGSVHGHYATTDKAPYITAKHGLMGLTRAIAAEGEGSLRSFSISPGYVLTPLMANQIADTAEERGIPEETVVEDVMLGQARLGELMLPIEVANLFVFGFSRHARHLNGGDLLWDGGYVRTYE